MADGGQQLSRGIQKTDVLSGAAITSVVTFLILTWTKSLPSDSTIHPYVSEQVISFTAGLVSYIVINILAFIRYEISLLLHERDYTKKIKYLDQIIAITTCQDSKIDLELQRNELLKAAAKAIIEERI